jgi:hypothetical protein
MPLIQLVIVLVVVGVILWVMFMNTKFASAIALCYALYMVTMSNSKSERSV